MTDQEYLDLSIKIWKTCIKMEENGLVIGENWEGRLACAILILEKHGMVKEIGSSKGKVWYQWVTGDESPAIEQQPLWA
jgi:hypothetical protein